MPKARLGVLVSGRGTNMQAIVDAIDRREVEAEIAVVISNHSDAPALGRAKGHGLLAEVFERKDYPTRAQQQRAIAARLESAGVDLVVLAGFDQVLRPGFIARFPDRIINIHPSLLPSFGGGLHAQAEALAHGVKISGCTVHLVTEEVDGGPIILQAAVPVLDDDTPEMLAARILVEEHRLLPRAIQLFAEGRLERQGRRVLIRDREGGPASH